MLRVHNAGTKPIPDMAVTICANSCKTSSAGTGVTVAAFGQLQQQPGIANPSRPVWIIDRPPGPCGYSCKSGGPGSWVTAYSNTWAIGRGVPPGATKTFQWKVTAVAPGTHVVAWQVAAGLNGKAHAVPANATTVPGGCVAQTPLRQLPAGPRRCRLSGTLRVQVTTAPQQSYVNDAGQVVTKP